MQSATINGLHKAMTSWTEKQAHRKEIERQTEEYLAKGGQITVCKAGQCTKECDDE